MSIFKRFFGEQNPKFEAVLIDRLHRLSVALRLIAPHWAEVLGRLESEFATVVGSGAPVSRRYELSREIERLFGGMGSLTDPDLPEESDRLRNELYAAVQDVLRLYWGKLGRECHSGAVEPLPVGTKVRLIPGKVRYINRDESKVVVKDSTEAREQVWRIVRNEGPDITNMQSYLLQREDTFMGARHEALEVVQADS